MAWWNFNKIKEVSEEIQEKENTSIEPSSLEYHGNFSYNPIVDSIWDGEKTAGELGVVENTMPDYLRLRLRAYDMNLKTDIIKIITGKFFKWIIGTGLKLQAEPNEIVLKLYGINEDLDKFQENAEALFSLYAKSKLGDYNVRQNLHDKANEAYKTSFLGGDCVCIIRFNDVGPNVQVIDGQQLQTPIDDKLKGEGNSIKNGIESNKKGEHIAFWISVSKEDSNDLEITHKRVEAYNDGILVAWIIYGDKHRIDHNRGIPYISSILEKTAKLDRYVEASVSKAEQTANVVYAFQHKTNSTGENILTNSLTSKKGVSSEKEAYEKSGKTASMLRQSTSGTVLNLTPDSELKSLSSESENNFEGFWRAVFTAICASVDIPPEVALQLFEQNYSSSRAAINGWEHLVEVHRDKFSRNFYDPFYRAWLTWNILNDKIKSPAFLKAKSEKDLIVLEAFYSARFTGKKMPHIDPLKEAKAMRAMLGSEAPLMSHEQAAEALGLGDWKENYKKYLKEDKIIPKEPKLEENVNSKKPIKDDKVKN